MSRARVKTLSWDAPIDAEIAQWPGVCARRERGGKHQRLILTFNGKERYVVYPSTPSDHRGQLNKIADVRRTLAELGAVRNERRKAAIRRARNKPKRDTLAHIKAAPVKADPWDALREIQYARPAEEFSLTNQVKVAAHNYFLPMRWAASAIVAVWRRLLAGSVRSTTSATRKAGDAQ